VINVTVRSSSAGDFAAPIQNGENGDLDGGVFRSPGRIRKSRRRHPSHEARLPGNRDHVEFRRRWRGWFLGTFVADFSGELLRPGSNDQGHEFLDEFGYSCFCCGVCFVFLLRKRRFQRRVASESSQRGRADQGERKKKAKVRRVIVSSEIEFGREVGGKKRDGSLNAEHQLYSAACGGGDGRTREIVLISKPPFLISFRSWKSRDCSPRITRIPANPIPFSFVPIRAKENNGPLNRWGKNQRFERERGGRPAFYSLHKLIPEGISAISRWLSESDTTGITNEYGTPPTPKGCSKIPVKNQLWRSSATTVIRSAFLSSPPRIFARRNTPGGIPNVFGGIGVKQALCLRSRYRARIRDDRFSEFPASFFPQRRPCALQGSIGRRQARTVPSSAESFCQTREMDQSRRGRLVLQRGEKLAFAKLEPTFETEVNTSRS